MIISARKRLALIVVLVFAFMMSVLAFSFTLVPAKADATGMVNGASIRYGEDRPGIRFSSYVPDSYFTNGKLNDGVEVGMLLVQAGNGTEADLTYDTTNPNVKKVSSNDAGFIWVNVRDDKVDLDEYQRYNVVVTDIPETAEAYGTEIIAKSYIKEGDNKPVYATNPQTRSIARVANQILAEDAGNDTISAREPETLKRYAFATEKPTQSTVNNRYFYLDGENLVWGAFNGAIGYYVCIDGQSIYTAETSIALSAFKNPVGKATLVAFGNGVDYSYSTVETCFVIDGSETIKGVSNGGYLTRATDARGLKSAEYSVENGAIEIKVDTLNSSRFATFRLELRDALNFTENAGVKIKFKVIEQPFTNADNVVWFTFVGDSSNWNESGGNNNTPYVEVVDNEWQVLSLTNAQLDTMLNNGDEYITLCVMRRSGSATNGIAKVLIDGVYAYNALETPTNLVVEDGVASWDAVANADGYVVSVNDEEQEVVTETSFDLSSLIVNPATYTVKVKAVINNSLIYVDSIYTNGVEIVVEPANVLESFNKESSIELISACGPCNTLWGSATYLTADANDGFGGHDGAVNFNIYKTDGFVDMFTVNLSKPINFEDNGALGLTIRMRLRKTPENTYSNGLDVFIGEPDADANREWYIRRDATKYAHLVTGGEWVEVYIPASALSKFVGQTVLHLGVGYDTGTGSGPKVTYDSVGVQLDYIKYTTIEEPANVLASFNNEKYTNVIYQLDTDSKISKVEYLEADGVHDGALQITLNQSNYTYMPMFGVNLANTLDLTTYSSIKVRMRVVSLPFTLKETDTIRAYVGYEMSGNLEYMAIQNDIADRNTALKLGDWVEITIPKTAYNLIDLYNGTKTLGLGIGFIQESGAPKSFSGSGGNVVIQIDYIKYA